jgi:hypothetical protein
MVLKCVKFKLQGVLIDQEVVMAKGVPAQALWSGQASGAGTQLTMGF